ncbi:MAG: DMT family transporter [Bacteroidota bacterium]
MKREKLLVPIGFVVVVAVWSTTWFAIKIGLNSIPPVFGIAFRFTLAALVLSIIMILRGDRVVIDKKSLLIFLMLGVFSFSTPYMLIYWAEMVVPTGLTSILFAAYPFVVAIGSELFLPQERMTVYKAAGILLGFAGIVVIFWTDLISGSSNLRAMGGILLSAIMQGTTLVMVKKHGKDISPFTLNLCSMVIGIIVLYTIAFSMEDISSIHFDAAGIGSIVYLGTFGTVIAFVVYYWLLKRVEAVYLSLISFITPIFAVILGALFLGEEFSSRVFSGAALVLLGILFTNGKDVKKIFEKQAGDVIP